jgi:hypothetical protein
MRVSLVFFFNLKNKVNYFHFYLFGLNVFFFKQKSFYLIGLLQKVMSFFFHDFLPFLTLFTLDNSLAF